MVSSGSLRRKVLIVEDEALVSMLLCDLVEDGGFEVVGPAATSAEALGLAEANAPQIALIDITLHGERSGVDLGSELVRRHGLSLIFISGHSGVDGWPEVQALAPVAVLQKPCLPAQVIGALEAVKSQGGP